MTADRGRFPEVFAGVCLRKVGVRRVMRSRNAVGFAMVLGVVASLPSLRFCAATETGGSLFSRIFCLGAAERTNASGPSVNERLVDGISRPCWRRRPRSAPHPRGETRRRHDCKEIMACWFLQQAHDTGREAQCSVCEALTSSLGRCLYIVVKRTANGSLAVDLLPRCRA